MIRINLLPPEYAEAQTRKERNFILAVVGVALSFFLIVVYGFKKAQSADLDRKIIQSESDLKKYQAIVDQIQNIEQQKNKLASKRDVIRNLNSSRLIYPVFLEDLLPLIPADVWVSDFELQRQSGSTLEYRLSSKALSNYALATWISNLEQSVHFSAVKLDQITYEYSGDKEKGAPPVLSFSIAFSYQHKGPMPLSKFN